MSADIIRAEVRMDAIYRVRSTGYTVYNQAYYRRQSKGVHFL